MEIAKVDTCQGTVKTCHLRSSRVTDRLWQLIPKSDSQEFRYLSAVFWNALKGVPKLLMMEEYGSSDVH